MVSINNVGKCKSKQAKDEGSSVKVANRMKGTRSKEKETSCVT